MTQTENPENSDSNEAEGCEFNLDDCSQEASQELEAAAGNSEEGELNLVTQLRTEIGNLKNELSASQDKYLRSLADLENFKKRSQKERSDLLKYQGEQLVVDLLSIIDNLDLAIQYQGGEFKDSDPEKFREGVALIYKNLCDVLKKWDIRPDSSLGKEFDPKKNLAISRLFNQDAAPGTVVSELKKAYYYKDKIIRVGEVVVAAEDPNAE